MTSTRSLSPASGPAPWTHPALRWAQHIDPDHVAAAPTTPAELRNVETLNNSATAVGTERLTRTRNVKAMTRRRDAARQNAAGAAALARCHQRRGDAAQADLWNAEAGRLTAAADALTVWILWLRRDSVPTSLSDPRFLIYLIRRALTAAALVQLPERPPEDHHPYPCRTTRRTPRSPRAPTFTRMHVTA